MSFRSHILRMEKMVSIGFLLLGLSSCVAQQADLVKLQKDFEARVTKLDQEKKNLEKDFEARVAKLDQEKKNLGQILAEANQAIQESQVILAQQKSEVSELIRARAEIKSELRSLREENLPKLSGELETEVHRLKSFVTQEVKVLKGDMNARDRARAKEIATLRENVKKSFAQQNKTMGANLAGLRDSLVDFKKVLAEIDRRIGAEQTRAIAAETNMRNEFEDQQAAIQAALQQQAEGTHQNLENLAKSIAQQDKGTHQNLENLAKSIAQLRTVGGQLGSKIDEHAQSLEKSDDRLEQAESQIAALSTKLKLDTEVLHGYLDKDIRTSLQSLATAVEAEKVRALESSKALEGLVETMSKDTQLVEVLSTATQSDLKQTKAQIAALDKYVKELNQSVVSAREVLDSMAGMLGKRSDDQMQEVGKLLAELEQMKQAQSSGLSQQDTNVQALSTHLKEVTSSVQSVVKSFGQMRTILTSRLDRQDARLEEQDQRLTDTANSSVSSEKVNQELTANVQYMNELRESLRQLKKVVYEISSKLGGKVDGHESQLARLKKQMQKSLSSLNTLHKRLKPLLQAPGLQ